MRHRAFTVLCALLLFGAAVAAPRIKWPPLPKDKFVSGRIATKADLDAGRAAFVAANGETITSKPLAIAIPQYAYFLEKESKIPVIVIQAEETQGMKMIGARKLDGKEVVGFFTEFQFLGHVPPGK